MANKRMFDKAIIDTDKFMDMPLSTKAIYFLLGMEADDEGFVSYKKVMRIHGGNDDDMRVLTAKNFVIQFESGVVVITDWNRNNWLDSRRIKKTEYQKEKAQLSLTKDSRYMLSTGLASIEENRGVYISELENSQVNNFQEVVLDLDGNESEKKVRKQKFDPKQVYLLFKDKVPANWLVNTTQRKSAENLYNERGIERIKKALLFYNENKSNEYCPEINSPYDLDSKWDKLAKFKTKNNL